MNTRKYLCTMMLGLCALVSAGPAHALLLNASDTIASHNEVDIYFSTLAMDMRDVRIWTDSFMNAANFDPIIALWDSSGNLIFQNDDNPTINPSTQTYFDSGMYLPTLAAGDYYFTVTSFNNFALGTNLADGFFYDQATPIPIDVWTNGGGGYYNVWFDGTPVPEPASMTLLGMGLGGLLLRGARRRQVN